MAEKNKETRLLSHTEQTAAASPDIDVSGSFKSVFNFWETKKSKLKMFQNRSQESYLWHVTLIFLVLQALEQQRNDL